MPINRELSQFGSFVEVANSTKLGIVNPNVGIGTTNPTVKVEVHGDIKVVDGNIDANGNLDVDGYSDLDELNVTGIATFTNGIQCSGSAMNVTAGFVANTARVSDLTDNRVVIAGNSGELEGDSNFTFDGSTLSVGADFTLTGIDTGTSAGPEFKLFRNSASPADADYLGQIKFAGESDTGVERNYAKITGKILDASNGTEDGIIEFTHIKAGSQNISARFRSDSLQLLNGTNFSVDGDSTLTGDLDVDGHTDLDYVAVSAAATFTSLVDVNGGLQANTIKIEDLTDNRVVIAGVGGELEDNSKFTFNGETVNINAQLTVSGVSTFSGGISMGSGSVGLTTNSITGPAEMFIDPAAVGDNTGVVRIKGDLYVDGTTTQINSETLTIADFVVGIASTATTDSLADGAGINIGPDNTFKYDHTNTSLKSSENLNVASGKTYKVNGTDVLSATTLGSGVVNSSLTSVGTLTGLTLSGDIYLNSTDKKIFLSNDYDQYITANAAYNYLAFGAANQERLRITSAGNVGIGTDNPGAKLHVSALGATDEPTIKVSSENSSIWLRTAGSSGSFPTGGVGNDGELIYLGGDFRFGVGTASKNLIFFNGSGYTERLRIDSSGLVGIGTDNPSYKLQVENSGVALGRFLRTNAGAGLFQIMSQDGGNIVLGLGDVSDPDIQYIKSDNSDNSLSLGTNTGERLRITSGGNVGIGTDNPSAKLHVEGLSSLSTTLDTGGILLSDTTTKTYPTSSSFNVTAGTNINLELGTTQTITGGYNYVTADNRTYTKSAGTTSDIERLYFASFNQSFAWSDANTCKQYIGFADKFTYSGINANGRSSSYLGASTQITLSPPDGGTQSIANVTSPSLRILPGGTSNVNITNYYSYSPQLRFTNNSAGTKTVNITNASYYDTSQYWGVSGSTGTLNATITNLYGLRLRPPSGSTGLTVTNNWGIYQEWSDATNYFAGNVGIGSDVPQDELDVHGNIITGGLKLVNNDRGNPTRKIVVGSSSVYHIRLYDPTDTTKLQSVFKVDGTVGIGTDSPAVQLHINSTDAIRVPVGTTGERPTGAAGYIRYNSSIASYEGHNGSEWAGIGGAAEVETAVSSTSATTCESFAKASYRSASIVAQITQGSSYQVGNYLLIHDGTTATLVEESAVATGDMLGTFTATISGSNVVFQVNMNSASSATVTSKMTKVSIP